MTTRLHHRLARLEKSAAARPDQRCRACGHLLRPRRGQTDPQVRYRAYSGVMGGPEPELGVPDYCPDCGRQLVYRLTFDRAG